MGIRRETVRSPENDVQSVEGRLQGHDVGQRAVGDGLVLPPDRRVNQRQRRQRSKNPRRAADAAGVPRG